MTKSKVMGLLLGGAIVLSTAAASAGWKGNAWPNAVCNSLGCWGSGSFGTTRATSNNSDEMLCYQSPTYADCTVYAGGVTASCGTTDPNMIAVIRSLNSDAYIYFASDTTGKCTTISTYNDSGYVPKTP